MLFGTDVKTTFLVRWKLKCYPGLMSRGYFCTIEVEMVLGIDVDILDNF